MTADRLDTHTLVEQTVDLLVVGGAGGHGQFTFAAARPDRPDLRGHCCGQFRLSVLFDAAMMADDGVLDVPGKVVGASLGAVDVAHPYRASAVETIGRPQFDQ